MKFRKRDFKFSEGQIFGNKVAESVNTDDSISISHEFMSAVVLEVISNPYEFLSTQRGESTLREILSKRYIGKDGDSSSIRNKELIDYMPMNSILVKLIETKVSNEVITPVICFPFFSSHLSLPIKPGEYVWILKEDIKGIDFYYWMSRKHGFIQNEDVNYTNSERVNAIVGIYNSYYSSNKTNEVNDLLIDNAVSFKNQKINTNIGIEGIINGSTAYKQEFTGEPVPRLAKDCGDLLIQGSNNAGIHLTTEKFNVLTDPNYFTSTAADNSTNRKPASAAIDIFVNRKHNDLTLSLNDKNKNIIKEKVNLIQNQFNDNNTSYLEINKISDITQKNDLAAINEIKDSTLDAIDVAGRLYLTANSSFDEAFVSNFNILSSHSGPAAILYGKNARIVSENTARIVSKVGQSFIDLDEEGNIVIKAAQGGAYISLKKDGSIAIVPGANGLLYLGGDEGDALNAALVQTGIPAAGSVTGIPITSTMGGVVGTDPPNESGLTGKFSSKLLIK